MKKPIMRSFALLLVIGSSALGIAQTPPVKPDTPDVQVPPVIEVSNPEKAGSPLGVAEAVAVALREQPTVTIAQASLKGAQARTSQAKAGLLPGVTLSASGNQNDLFRGSSSSSNYFRSTGAVTLSQLVFDFGKTRDLVRQQGALEKAATLVLTRTQLDTALAVKTAFYSYVAAIDSVRVAEGNLATRQSQYALAEAKLNTGSGQPADYVQAKTAVADAVLSLTAARQQSNLARIALAVQMGIDPRTPINPAESSEAPPASDDLATLVDSALANRPEMAEYRARLAAAGYAVSNARKASLPGVSLAGSVTGTGSDFFENQYGSVGLTLSWPIFDSGLVAGKVKEARSNLEQVQAQMKQTSQQVITDVSQAYLAVKTAEQNLEVAKVQVANAREYVRITSGRYQGGVGAFLDMVTAQSSEFSAEKNVVQATGDVQRARAQLARALGK